MIQAIYASGTGLLAAQASLNVTGNNLANIDTTGFKTSRAGFQDLFYATLALPAAAGQKASPDPIQVGRGTTLSSVRAQFTQGGLQSTGNPLDVAINGPGFFQVTRPDGTTAFTRAGALQTDATGRLVTDQGDVLSPAITIPAGATSIGIGPDGTVTAVVNGATVTAGQITLASFSNPAGLIRIGDTLFAATPASGAAVVRVPGQGGAGTLQQGSLEGSNVDAATELTNLIIAQQAFAANVQALTVANQIEQQVINIFA